MRSQKMEREFLSLHFSLVLSNSRHNMLCSPMNCCKGCCMWSCEFNSDFIPFLHNSYCYLLQVRKVLCCHAFPWCTRKFQYLFCPCIICRSCSFSSVLPFLLLLFPWCNLILKMWEIIFFCRQITLRAVSRDILRGPRLFWPSIPLLPSVWRYCTFYSRKYRLGQNARAGEKRCSYILFRGISPGWISRKH